MKAGYLLWLMFAVGIACRLFLVYHQPFTNDEGAYLYDAQALSQNRIPAGDVLVKSPAVIVLFSVGVALTRSSLFASRFVSLAATLLALWPLTYVANRFGGKPATLWASGLWLASSGPIIFFSFGHTEALAAFWTCAAFALSLAALEKGVRVNRLAYAAGVCFALAFASRKIELLTVIPLVWVAWNRKKEGVNIAQQCWAWLFGVLTIALPLLVFIANMYGVVGIEQFIGGGYGSLIVRHIGVQTSLPWWGSDRASVLKVEVRVALLSVLLGAAALAWTLRSLFPWQRKILKAPSTILMIWALCILIAYFFWPGILPDYLADAFVPLTLLSALFASWVTDKITRWQANIFIALCALASIFGLVSNYLHPWTGMFSSAAIYQAADELRKRIPINEPVFTAAAIIPYVSGHHLWGEVSHPLWYRYPFIPEEVKKTFLPSLSEIVYALKSGQVKWVITEDLTNYAYAGIPADVGSLKESGWHVVDQIPNATGFRSNSLYILQVEDK
jgi:hypothetical protein